MEPNPSLFMGFAAHNSFSAFCCGMRQYEINPKSLAVPGPAHDLSSSSNLCNVFNLQRKQRKHICAWHRQNIRPFILLLKLGISFQIFSSRQDTKKKTKCNLPLLHMHIPIHPGVSLCTAYFSVSSRSLEETWKVC